MKTFNQYLSIFLLFFSVVSCKKDDIQRPTFEDDELENDIKYEVFKATKYYSLWEEFMPPKNSDDIYNRNLVREYTKYYQYGEDVLDYMTSQTPISNITKKPIDRYSYLDRAGSVRKQIVNGVSKGFGTYLVYVANQSGNNAHLYISMVDNNSPAKQAGLRRGLKIISINGNSDIDYQSQQKKDFEFINQALNSSEITFVVIDELGNSNTFKVNDKSYSNNSILKNDVLLFDNKKIGYLAFNSFNDVGRPGSWNTMHTVFENIFNEFESSGIDELVIDMRYNGGGATNTSEYFANRIISTQHNGKLMYTYKINKNLINEGLDKLDRVFAPVYFTKYGNLNLKRVYFLVSNQTASASELLINILKPYMDVQMIGAYGRNGQKDNTYGKPVGSFSRTVLSNPYKIDLHVISFQLFNSVGFGDYYGGLVPDKHEYEGFDRDFGDPKEGLLAEALYHIKTKSYHSTTSSSGRSVSTADTRDLPVIFKSFGQTDPSSNNMYKFGQ